MNNYIFVGCDSHDKTLVLKIASNREPAERKTFAATGNGRQKMIAELKRRAAMAAAGATVVIGYEASGNGFILRDELTAAGFICWVLAPTKIERSSQQKRNKDDDRDADRILEILRGHYLAGNRMPSVWVPDLETRDDREPIRARQDVVEKRTAVKTQIQTLLKRHGIEKPQGLRGSWSRQHREWLKGLAEITEGGAGMRANLASLLRQLAFLDDEVERLDREVQRVADKPRWQPVVQELRKEVGVGLMVSIKYATEIGDFKRFRRGRQVGAFFGVTPSSNESGETRDRKGHITRQGSPTMRQLLCQAAWTRIRRDKTEREVFERLVKKNPKKRKIALVACIRRLSVKLWHVGIQAQTAAAEAAAQKM